MVRSVFLPLDPAPRMRVVDGVEVAAAYSDDVDSELATLRTGAAVTDRSHRGRIRITGTDRVGFLHGQTSADVKRLRPGSGALAAFLTGKGKMRGFGMVHADHDALTIACDGAAAPPLSSHLKSFVIMDDVAIADVGSEVAQLAVVGAGAAPLLEAALGLPNLMAVGEGEHVLHAGHGLEYWVARDGSLGLPLFEIVVAASASAALWARLRSALPAVGFDALEALRIDAGFPRWGVDIGDDAFPIEAGLARAIDYDKGCFTGYEVMARIRTYGHVNRHLVGLVLPPSNVAAGDAVEFGGARVGRVTSVASAASETRALAMVATVAAAPGATVEISTKGGVVTALVRPLAKAPLAV